MVTVYACVCVCAVWLSRLLCCLAAPPSRPDGKHIDQKSFSGNYNEQALQRKSADCDCRLAAESLKDGCHMYFQHTVTKIITDVGPEDIL